MTYWLRFTIALLICSVSERPFTIAQLPQSSRLPYQQLSPQSGLRGTFIYGVSEDENGWLWLASPRGLGRYDGSTIDYFTVEEGLFSNEILNCVSDQDGQVWAIGHKVPPVFIHRNKVFPVLGLNLAPDETIRRIAPLKGGKAWIFSSHHLYQFEFGRQVQMRDDLKRSYQLQYALEDQRGLEWWLTPAGVWSVKREDTTLIPFPGPVPDSVVQLRAIPSFEGRFLVSGKDIGLLHFRPEDGSWEKIQVPKESGDLSQEKWWVDQEGNLWGTDGQGITLLNRGENYQVRHDLWAELRVMTLAFDRRNNLWISTPENGLLLVRAPVTATWEWGDEEGLPGKKVTALAQDSTGSIWLGFDNGNIAILKGNEINTIEFEPFKAHSRRIRHIHCDGSGRVWVAGANGLHCFPNPETVYSFPIPEIKSLDPHSDGTLWMGGSAAILKLKAATLAEITPRDHGGQVPAIVPSLPFYARHIEYELPQGAYALLVREEGQIRAANSKGIWARQVGDSLLRNASGPARLVTRLARGPGGGVWTGTENKGLFYENGSQSRHFDAENGLSGDYIQAIARGTAGRYWVATNAGVDLIRTIQRPPQEWQPEPLQILQSVAAREYLSVLEADNFIYVGTNRGLIAMDMNRMDWTEKLPGPILKKVEVAGEERTFERAISLEAEENEIAFHLRTILPARPAGLAYQYRLLGADDAFRIAENPVIRFFNLSPGQYQLECATLLPRGESSEETLIIPFTIHEKWYQRWTFQVPLGVLLLAIIGGFVWWRWKESRRWLELKLRLQETQQQALQAQMNPHFIFNVMNVVQEHILHGDALAANQVLARIARLIRRVMELVRVPGISLREEMDFLNLYLSLENARLEEPITLEWEMGANIDPDQTAIPTMVLQPLLENAIRHGFPRGFRQGWVRISLTQSGSELTCTVRDNGVGRVAAAQYPPAAGQPHVSRGLELTRERLDILSERFQTHFPLEIQDLYNHHQQPLGTQITLKLPIL